MARGRHLVAGRFAHPGPSTGVSTCMGKLYRFWILDERLYYVDLFQGLRVCNTDRRGALWIKGLCFFFQGLMAWGLRRGFWILLELCKCVHLALIGVGFYVIMGFVIGTLYKVQFQGMT